MQDSTPDATEAPAAVSRYERIDREQAPDLYALLDALVSEHHASDLAEARIALMWRYEVRPDRDGHVTLGKARKVSDRERQFHDHDFVIELNHEAWQTVLDSAQRQALLDHELEHCGRAEAEDGSSVYYIRKHDVEEFRAVVKRNGIWKQDLQDFVDAALCGPKYAAAGPDLPFEPAAPAPATARPTKDAKKVPVAREAM